MYKKREAIDVVEPPCAVRAARATRWCVLRTPPGKEVDSGRLLADLGFLAWCPLQQEWRRVGRGVKVRKRSVRAPAFIRYIFVGAPDEREPRWRAALRTGLIDGILADGAGRPVWLAASAVAAIAERQRRGELGRALAAPDRPTLKVGELVRVVAGPFRGFTYRVEAVNETSVRVLAILLGAERFVDLALDGVVKAA